MTWWSSLYFALYVTFTLWSVTDDLKNKLQPLWHVALEIIGDICLLLVALSYWVPSLRSAIEPILVPLYVAAVVILAAQLSRSFRRNVLSDKELPLQGKVVVGFGAATLISVVMAPALVWGFISAVLSRANGT